MTIRQQLIEYSHNCIDDVFVNDLEDYISCKKHKQACQRFLDDLEKDWDYHWDEEEARKIVKWFSYLKHQKGILAGQGINLTIWQRFCLCQIYGWRNKETGNKRFSSSFIEVARKNAKSQIEAGVLLNEISVQATKNGEIYETYCAGTKRDQSKIIFDECVNLLKGSILNTKFNCKQNIIIHIKTGSYLKALCKEDGKKGDGTNPAVLVLDEYHQHKSTEFYDLGLGANTKESLLMIVTTAGMDLTYPCFTQEYKYCSEILDPNFDVVNDNYFVDICEMDKGDNIKGRRNWKKANPLRMTYSVGVEQIEKAYQIAEQVPEKMIAFMTKCLNIWVQSKENGYMDMDKWKACQVEKITHDLKNKSVYVGFDMSSKIDLTSVAFNFPLMIDGVAKYVIKVHSFIPNREKLMERVFKDKVPYDAWEREGYLTVTNTPIVDQQQVMDYVERACKENGWIIKTLCFDPANSSKLMMDLSNQGYECVEVYQSHKSLNESTAGFREEVFSGNVEYEYNPLLNFAMANAVVKQYNGLIKIDKDATNKKIDPIDAILGAHKLARYHEFEVDLSKYLTEENMSKLWG